MRSPLLSPSCAACHLCPSPSLSARSLSCSSAPSLTLARAAPSARSRKLANIEATEKAKRQLSDAKAAAYAARLAHDEADEMAADRCAFLSLSPSPPSLLSRPISPHRAHEADSCSPRLLAAVYRHRRPLESDTDALERARAAALAAADPALADPDYALRKAKLNGGRGGAGGGGGRKELATDEMAMARFRKREGGKR